MKNYPEGFYNTLEDFLAKSVTPFENILRVDVKTLKLIAPDTIVDHFFSPRLKILQYSKKYLLSHTTAFFILNKRILLNTQVKGDRVDRSENPRSYHRVIMDGNFFYMEAIFANIWKTGAGYNMGIAGSAIASAAHQLKPIIFNFETKRFDLFRNCEELNSFLKSKNPSTNLNCEQRYLPLADAKAILEVEIKK